MRGLKLSWSIRNWFRTLSHLLQMRGLKRAPANRYHFKNKSHLLQMRGLKPIPSISFSHVSHVASFTDAWIETIEKGNFKCSFDSRIFYRCVDWNISTTSCTNMVKMSHLLQMRGLKLLRNRYTFLSLCRIFYRCVDWNFYGDRLWLGFMSHLLQMRGLKP